MLIMYVVFLFSSRSSFLFISPEIYLSHLLKIFSKSVFGIDRWCLSLIVKTSIALFVIEHISNSLSKNPLCFVQFGICWEGFSVLVISFHKKSNFLSFFKQFLIFVFSNVFARLLVIFILLQFCHFIFACFENT